MNDDRPRDAKGRPIGALPQPELDSVRERKNAEEDQPPPSRRTREPQMNDDTHIVLAHPERRRIMDLFRASPTMEASASELWKMLDEANYKGEHSAMSNVTHHCRFMEERGVLRATRLEQVRGATKRYFGLTNEGLKVGTTDAEAGMVLDKMAAAMRQHGKDNPSEAYTQLAELLVGTGRQIEAEAVAA